MATIDEGQEPRDSDEGPHADGQTPQTDGRRKRYAYRDVFSPSSPKKQAPLPTELGKLFLKLSTGLPAVQSRQPLTYRLMESMGLGGPR